MVRTDIGPVAVVIWRFSRGADTLAPYEQYLDPLHEPTVSLLRRVAAQPRIVVVVRDNQTGEAVGYSDVENHFQMGNLADRMAQAAVVSAPAPFRLRLLQVQRDCSVEDLMAAAEAEAVGQGSLS